MHRHFEHQLNEMMKVFGMNIFGMPFSPFRNDNSAHTEEHDARPAIENGIRDQYLKPGYQTESPSNAKVTDSDLDGVYIHTITNIIRSQ